MVANRLSCYYMLKTKSYNTLKVYILTEIKQLKYLRFIIPK